MYAVNVTSPVQLNLVSGCRNSGDLQMFLDTMEPRTENKNSSLEKNCFDNVGSDMWKIDA